MRVRMNEKTESKSKSKSNSNSRSMTVTSTRWRGFDEPLLLASEDPALYRELQVRVHAAVQPGGIIEEMYVNDIVCLQWEVLRWRKFKTDLMRARGLSALESFLCEHLDYDGYCDKYEDYLVDILQENLPEDQAKTLARDCALNEPEAVNKVKVILNRTGRDMDVLLNDAKVDKAREIVREYAQRDPDAIALVDKQLEVLGTSIAAVVADAFTKDLADIERLDRLATIAEERRNASLREIDRHRLVLGEAVRRTVQQIEEAEFAVIEPTPNKKEKMRREPH
jgi:hypothetical protein